MLMILKVHGLEAVSNDNLPAGGVLRHTTE